MENPVKALLDQVIRSFINISDPQKAAGMKAYMKNQFEFAGITSGMLTGPNKLTLRRTGGTLAGWIILDYVMVEYLPGAALPVLTLTSDPILGTRTLAWTAAVAKTYRVQKSADGGATWSDLAAGFPSGGAPGTSLFYEDRVTPHTDPAPAYRVLLE